MAKATVTREDGTKITVEGTPEDVAALIDLLGSPAPRASLSKRRHLSARPKAATRARARGSGPTDLIRLLTAEGFFKTKKRLVDVQKKLEESGHIYAQDSLGRPLQRLVQQKELRRLKEDGVWKYVNP